MVDYFFNDPEKDAELKKSLDEWLDTPFRHQCGVKGLGCDCVHFAIAVLAEFNLINLGSVKIPDYPRDWHLHNTREVLKEAILKYLNVEQVNKNGILMNGDITLAHYGQASSHVGIYYDNHVYQAINKIGVKSIHFKDIKFFKQIKFVYRILK